MDRTGTVSLEDARRLHRAGRLAEALGAYEALLAGQPDDPDLVGLLGVLALQSGRQEDAEAYLRRSLSLDGDGRLRLRNLNNFIVLLRETGRGDEARALLEDETPEWPNDTLAADAERVSILSLTEALIGYGQPGKARRLFDQAIPDRDGDAVAAGLDGRLRLAEGDAAGAVEPLERAARLAPDDCLPPIALSYAYGQLGQPDMARAAARKLATRHPVYSAPAKPSQRAAILVLNPYRRVIENPNIDLRGLHFSANYGSQVAASMQDEFRFFSLFGDLPADELPDQFPQADIVLNNIVNSEPMNRPGRLDTVRANAERSGRPVINHPNAVFQTTRQKNALLLAGIPNLKVPRIERYRTSLASAGEIAADIGGRFDYPVILRKIDAHQSSDSQLRDDDRVAVLLATPAALRDHLERFDWGEFYAVEFVDLKRKDGFYRQQRAVIANGEVIVSRSSMNREWMVTSWRSKPEGIAFYRANPQIVDECNRIVREPEAHLGGAAIRTLAAIGQRIPLDIFGIDFEVDREGRVIFFEASAAMILQPQSLAREPEDIRLPMEPLIRIDDAFRDLVARRIARDPHRPE